MITAKLVKLSICDCGYTLLNDNIKLGQEYEVDESYQRAAATLTCGGCDMNIPIEVVYARRGRHPWGWLPAVIFDL